MTKFTVSWSCDLDAEDVEHAAHEAFKKMVIYAGTPHWGNETLHVVNEDTGEEIDIDIIDAMLVVDPLLVSQVFGFRHMVWVSQGQGRR